jgi:hypothetical protein
MRLIDVLAPCAVTAAAGSQPGQHAVHPSDRLTALLSSQQRS